MNVENSQEFVTCDGEFSTKGGIIPTRCLDSRYVGDEIKNTIGLSGISGLWIFGNP